MQVQSIEKTFCTTRDAAVLLGVSVRTIQLWVESGLLEAWKTVGGHRRVMRDSVLGLLHQRPVTGAPSASRATPFITAPRKARRKLQVLVIDDSPASLRLYKTKMAAWAPGPVVSAHENAIAALMQIGRNGIDLLVADLQMPGMDAIPLLRFLAAMPEFGSTTIVAVTTLTPAEIAEGGGLPPAIEVLSKPVPFERLRAIADSIAERKQLARKEGQPCL